MARGFTDILTALMPGYNPHYDRRGDMRQSLLEHIERERDLRREGSQWAADEYGRFIRAASVCESPIEELLLAAVRYMFPPFGIFPEIATVEWSPEEAARTDCRIMLYPQAKFGRYRADILAVVQAPNGLKFRVDLEADGAEFHDATEEQRENDRVRNAYFVKYGAHVRRFSGSRITFLAHECRDVFAELVQHQASVCVSR